MLIAQILKYFNIIFKSFTFSIKFILKYYITIYHLYLSSCGPCISAQCVSHSNGELDFLFSKNWFLFVRKWLGVATYFCFIFKRVNKIRKKTLGVTPYFGKGWSTKNRIRFGGQVTYREGTVKTVTPF